MERLVAIAGGAEIIVGGLMTAYPQLMPQWVGFIVIVVGVTTVAYALLMGRRPQPSYFGTPMPDVWMWNWPAVRFEMDFDPPLSRLVPLRECARLAYEKTRGSNAAKMAERGPNGHEGILRYYAIALTERDGATLYGKKPPSTKYEVVPHENMGKYHFVESLSAVAYHGKTEIEYEELRLKRSELRRKIKDIRSW